MTPDQRVSIGAYWAACSPTRKLELAQRAGLTVDYIGKIANGKRTAGRLACIRIIAAAEGAIRPFSMRPDLWGFSASIPSDYIDGLASIDHSLEAQIDKARKAWIAAADAPKATQRELAAELAHLIRQRDDGVATWLEVRRAHIGLANPA